MSSLQKSLFRPFPHFWLGCLFFWYWLVWAVYIRWNINPLSFEISFANIFYHSVGCLFILLMVSFAVQKLLGLSRSHLYIFVFISITVGDRSNKIMLWFMSESVLPKFSSRSYIVSSFTFRSLIYFELIFVYEVKEWSNFIFLNMYVTVQFSQHHLLKRLSFQRCALLPPLS